MRVRIVGPLLLIPLIEVVGEIQKKKESRHTGEGGINHIDGTSVRP